LENVESDEAERINLDDIGVGHKNRVDQQLFGASNVNQNLARQFEKQA
jgi:hypothetical protein